MYNVTFYSVLLVCDTVDIVVFSEFLHDIEYLYKSNNMNYNSNAFLYVFSKPITHASTHHYAYKNLSVKDKTCL